MIRTLVSLAAALALVVSLASAAFAQEKPGMVPLKLDLLISRQAGEKKISSMPYAMWVTANAPERSTNLRMGVQVPVTTTIFSQKEGAPTEPMRSFTYRDIGTNIDATASTAPDGRFAVAITLTDSGLHEKGDASTGGAPLLRNFTSRFYLLLRDGQTVTYTSATDPVTGETLRVEVTLSVLK